MTTRIYYVSPQQVAAAAARATAHLMAMGYTAHADGIVEDETNLVHGILAAMDGINDEGRILLDHVVRETFRVAVDAPELIAEFLGIDTHSVVRCLDDHFDQAQDA